MRAVSVRVSVQSSLALQGSSVEQVGSWGRASIEFAMDDVGDDGQRMLATASTVPAFRLVWARARWQRRAWQRQA